MMGPEVANGVIRSAGMSAVVESDKSLEDLDEDKEEDVKGEMTVCALSDSSRSYSRMKSRITSDVEGGKRYRVLRPRSWAARMDWGESELGRAGCKSAGLLGVMVLLHDHFPVIRLVVSKDRPTFTLHILRSAPLTA
jgi:hypothetical protein